MIKLFNMKIIEPHLDIADFYILNNWRAEEFYKHNSSAWATLPKLKKAGVDFVWLSLYFDEGQKRTSFYDGVISYYKFYQEIINSGKGLKLIQTAEEFSNKTDSEIGFFYSVEGLECIRKPEDFLELYDLGVRSFGFSWDNGNEYCSGRHSKEDTGISKKGLELIKLMGEKEKLIIDIAHLSSLSIQELAENWDGMIVTTHSNSRKTWDHPHNLTDEEISLIVERGGVIGLFPFTEAVGPNNNFDDLYRHLEYIASKWGIDFVGFSSDIYPLPEYLFLNNAKDVMISKDWNDYLLEKMSRREVEKIMYKNWERVINLSL